MKKLFYLFVCAGFLSGCHVGHNSETLINNNQKSVNGIESSGFQTSNFGKYSNFNGVAYGDGIYVAVGNNGAISVSFDNGKSWSSVDSYASVNLNAVTFDNVGKKFYAVGNEGVIISSTNGIDWNSRTPLTPVINLLTVLAVDGNLFIGGQRGLVFEIDYRTGSVTLRGGLTAANVVSSGYDAKNGIMYIGNSDGSIQHKYISIWTTTQWTNPYYVSSSEITGVSFDSIDNVVLLSDSFGNVYWGGKFAWSAPLYTNFGKLSQIFYDIKSDSFLSVTNSGLAYSKDFNFWALTETGGVGYKNVLCNGEICVATGLNGLLRYSSSRDVNGIPQFLEPESVNFTKKVILAEPSNETQIYGRDSLLNIKMGNYGLKGFDVVNVSSETVKISSAIDPALQDITVDYGRSSCFQGNPNANRSLLSGASCSLVYKYLPTKATTAKKFLAGLNVLTATNQVESSPLVNIYYSASNN